jgi:hypothetical protein
MRILYVPHGFRKKDFTLRSVTLPGGEVGIVSEVNWNDPPERRRKNVTSEKIQHYCDCDLEPKYSLMDS